MPKIKRNKPKSTRSLADQVKGKTKKSKIKKETKSTKEYVGDTDNIVSTGSTLLDLAISGGRVKGGGIPSGIMVIAYGPPGGGKTALACEVAGSIMRKGGDLTYIDSEGRLDKEFAKNFDLDRDKINYERERLISKAFLKLYKWDADNSKVNGYVVDSLAALSTELEQEKDEGDKMGMKRAKEFSANLRKCAIPIVDKNILLFCTNQIRENADAGPYARKDVNPGGKAIEFYASLVLRFSGIKIIRDEFKFGKKKKKKEAIGMSATIEVVKSSVWKPHRKADIIIYFDYGIDDIRVNLQYVKDYTGASTYAIRDKKLAQSLDDAVVIVEKEGLEKKLRKQVIEIWEEYQKHIEEQTKRKKKKR